MILRDLENKIINDINESGLSIDAVYFVMKSIMQEVAENYRMYSTQEDLAKNTKDIEQEDKVDKE